MSAPEPTVVAVEEVKPAEATPAVEPTAEPKVEESAVVVSLATFFV